MTSQIVSIIIPIHNRKRYLAETLESVAAQTYQNLQVILVDDASEEDIGSVARTIQWPQQMTWQYQRSDINIGPGAARELGRQQAAGEYFAYLDSDDVWHPEKVEKQVQALRHNPQAGMCYCVSTEFEALPLTGSEPIRKRSDQAFGSFLPNVLYGRPWGTSACMWTRKSTERIGPWYPGWTWEDYEYDCRAGCKDIRIAFIPYILCHYRRANNGQHLSVERSSFQRTKGRALSLLKMGDELRAHGKLQKPDIRGRIVSLVYSQAISLLRHQDKALAKKCLEFIWDVSPNLQTRALIAALQTALPVLSAPVVGRFASRYRNLLVFGAEGSAYNGDG